MRFFNPQQGQRVWYRSADRTHDVFELQQVLEDHKVDWMYVMAPYQRAIVRRSNRNLGPTVYVGPTQSPLAGCP